MRESLVEAELFDLIRVFADIIKRRRPAFDYHATQFRFTVIDRMETILKLLAQRGDKIDLKETLEGLDLTRELVVATFLAVLELTRIGRVRIHQPKGHESIYLFERASSVWLTN